MEYLKNVDDPKRFGVAELNSDGTIKSIEEKPKVPRSNYAVTGLYLYEEKIFEIIKTIINKIGYSNRGELEITDVNNYYIENGKVKPVVTQTFDFDQANEALEVLREGKTLGRIVLTLD